MTFGVYSNNIIGYLPPFCKGQFTGSDDAETFERNLLAQPTDWIYRTLNIDYTRNKIGHRSKDFSKVDRNYLLFIGCSLTEGIGIPIENAYPSVVAKHFKIDHYNMGLGGVGPDVIYHNLHQLIKLEVKKPKFVFIQWPEPVRYSHLANDKSDRILNYLETKLPKVDIVIQGSWGLPEEELLVREEEAEREFPEIVFQVRQLLNDAGYKFIDYQPFKGVHFGRKYKVELSFNGRVAIVDQARDILHPGIETHKNFARLLINKIQRDRLI